MKYLAFFLLFIILFQHLSAQSPVEKAYIAAIDDGPSTGPDFVVVTIINSNTNQSKEMILSVDQLFDCLKLELIEDDYKKIKKYLLSKSSDRTISLQNQEALKSINFEKYKAENTLQLENEIDKVIIKNHLIDSLSKIAAINQKSHKLFDEYYMRRVEILREISDSISKLRSLNKKEKTVLQFLKDPYYDGREEQCEKLPSDSKDDRISRKKILEIWDNKINLYKSDRDKYAYIDQELTRCEKKFFRSYYNKNGITFCKALFKYGAICYFGDENPIVGFGGLVK